MVNIPKPLKVEIERAIRRGSGNTMYTPKVQLAIIEQERFNARKRELLAITRIFTRKEREDNQELLERVVRKASSLAWLTLRNEFNRAVIA